MRTPLLLLAIFAAIFAQAATAPAQSISVRSHKQIAAGSNGFDRTLNEADAFGSSLVRLGDLDGDGAVEFAIGAPGDNDGGDDTGAVWLLALAADGSVTTSLKISASQGEFPGELRAGDRFGHAVAVLGDLDGDGAPELVVGAPGDNGTRGAVWLLFLDRSARIKKAAKIDSAVMGDAMAEGDFFGAAVAVLGDLDGDGIPDLAVGAPGRDGSETATGRIHILLLQNDGSVKAHSRIGNGTGDFGATLQPGDRFGAALAAPGDLDGNGTRDLIAGAPGDNDGGSDRGALWMLFLRADGRVASQQKISASNGGFAGVLNDGDRFGAALAVLPDLNADSIIDIVAGAPGADDGGSNRGALWVLFLNKNGTLKSQRKISASEGRFTGQLADNDAFGQAIAYAGDLDGDGIPDLLAGAPGSDRSSSNEGAAWLLFLDNRPVVRSTVRFQVETTPLRQLGLLDPQRGDTLLVKGEFNRWGTEVENARLRNTLTPDPDLFAIDATVDGVTGSTIAHFFHLGQAGGKSAREFPLLSGGVPRQITLQNSSAQTVPPVYFNDLAPQGIVPAGSSVTCTLRVNMQPALTAARPFLPLLDKVFLYLADPWWAATQGRAAGVQADLRFTDSNADMIYELPIRITGPAHYGLLYRIAYGPESSDLKLIEGGDPAQTPSRVRYIQPLAPNSFPPTFTFPADRWQSGADLPVQTPPFEPVPPANKPPVLLNELPNLTLPLGAEAFNIDLRAPKPVFFDPNGDALVYTTQLSNPAIVKATVTGAILTLETRVIGQTTVTVRADDQKGGTASTSFELTVERGNQPPQVINPIVDQVMSVDGKVFTQNLDANFSDPNNDPLSYSASSSVPGVASASITGSLLRVSPISVGSTNITVTADDNNGGRTSLNFNVVVSGGNQAPRVLNAIANQRLTVGGSAFERDLLASPIVFVDPNGDSLRFSSRSGNTSIATTAMNGTQLRVQPVAAGEAIITVTADDGRGASASMAFTVTVEIETRNNAPVIANRIENQVLIAGGSSFALNLDAPPPVFRDDDGDRLDYTASSSSPEVADATIFGSLLTVAPIAVGKSNIRVTANDGAGGTESFIFQVQVNENQPPRVRHTPGQLQPSGEPMIVDAEISDDTGVTGATLRYRRGGDTHFNPVAMSRIGMIWQGTVPGGDVTARGIEYYIQAQDQHGSTAETEVHAVRVAIAGDGLASPRPQPAGSEQTAYRLFSIPLELTNAKPASVLLDDLGEYDIKKWRFFEMTASQGYQEFGRTSDFAPGKAFWLIVKDNARTIDSGPGTSVSTAVPFAVELHPQWNLIGNPFNFAIPIENVRLQRNGETPIIRAFDGQWSDPAAVTVLEPFKGYAVFNSESAPEVLLLDPNVQAQAGKSADALPFQWAVRISASSQQARDAGNFAGVIDGAAAAWDPFDQPAPPMIGDYVSVAFPHPAWPQLARRLSVDARPPGADGYRWEFEVRTSIRDAVRLGFDGIDSVPAAFGIWLIDEQLGLVQDLRRNPVHLFAGKGDGSARHFSLAIGAPGMLGELAPGEGTVPQVYELGQNFPNPFNPVTTIRFGLPRASAVSVVVYNLLGEVVSVLLQEAAYEAGYHTVVWDGRNRQGQPSPSGVYFYRITAGEFARVKKMLLVR